MELLVSGTALFATLSLPDLLDSALVYYRYTLMSDTDFIHEIIPAQVLGLIKGVSYLLFTAFLIHFVMHAFWAGLVGLPVVYPKGIDYEKVHYLRMTVPDSSHTTKPYCQIPFWYIPEK